ncbi:hypothetical protein PLICRDRAFT_33063 [Plicaturopsis crispa FD-325 SS-3]|uniref:F-box domain-containing protein n=1 Tax=Plicaturopsis crispa FD-325 SS-3 TaxID=944288 RepID=A0A0C9T1R0_PLICR|nr:hypothetical protein PLICRDRAFT_33063 [Plicaturopsis crispa FD-325 SS-3]
MRKKRKLDDDVSEPSLDASLSDSVPRVSTKPRIGPSFSSTTRSRKRFATAAPSPEPATPSPEPATPSPEPQATSNVIMRTSQDESPRHPSRVVTTAAGNIFTEEDKRFFRETLLYEIRKNKNVSRAEILRILNAKYRIVDIFHFITSHLNGQAPHHSKKSWDHHWERTPGIKSIVRCLRNGEMISQDAESDDWSSEDSDSNSNSVHRHDDDAGPSWPISLHIHLSRDQASAEAVARTFISHCQVYIMPRRNKNGKLAASISALDIVSGPEALVPSLVCVDATLHLEKLLNERMVEHALARLARQHGVILVPVIRVLSPIYSPTPARPALAGLIRKFPFRNLVNKHSLSLNNTPMRWRSTLQAPPVDLRISDRIAPIRMPNGLATRTSSFPTKRRGKWPPVGKHLQRASLSLIVGMPYDVILAVASELEPRDLYNLAYVNKELSGLLLNKSSSSNAIWKRALARTGLPPCPDDLTLPAYTRLVFFNKCTFCWATVYTVSWMLKLRCCERCELTYLVRADRLDDEFREQGIHESCRAYYLWHHMLRPMGVYKCSGWEYYKRAEVDLVLQELKHIALHRDGLNDFLESRAKIIGASRNFARVAALWECEERWRSKDLLKYEILERLAKDFHEEWPIEVDFLRTCSCTTTEWNRSCYNPFKSMFLSSSRLFWPHTHRQLTDDDWEDLKPVILQHLSGMRDHPFTRDGLECFDPRQEEGRGYLF